ncbi:MAG TPA: hypothetical protein VMF30_08280 [Pirellulales bacterium]|nr:hypothetical protein [Pirellulales bacterium]
MSQEELVRVLNAHRKHAGCGGPESASAAVEPSAGESRGARRIGRLIGLDSNHDGKVSFAEFSAADQELFSCTDANHDRLLDREEIQQCVAARAAKMSNEKPVSDENAAGP